MAPHSGHCIADFPDSSFNYATPIHIIFNPISGQGDAAEELATIQSSLEKVGEITTHLTQPDKTAETLAQTAIAAGADWVIAAGGDGTVSAVASALIGTDIPMGIVPRGTVNAFAAAMEIPDSIIGACDGIVEHQIRRVDTAQCNDRTMLLLVSVGFEANLMNQIDRQTKNRFGRLAIFTHGIREWLRLPKFQAIVETADQTLTFDAAAVTVANAATVGTILAQGPAEINTSDGCLDLTVLAPKSRWSALASAAKLFFSGIFQQQANHQDVDHCQAAAMTITAEPPQDIIVDGELVGKTPVTVECFKHSLQVIVPKRT